jgi:hypothetical protein
MTTIMNWRCGGEKIIYIDSFLFLSKLRNMSYYYEQRLREVGGVLFVVKSRK